jgi:uncharacterized protein
MADATGETTTYLLVDGENIDATLGASVLGRRPAPEERPRWDRVRDFAQNVWDQPVRGLFFLNATSGSMPMSFVQALLALDYRPIPLAGGPGEKVVDIGIQRTLEALESRPGDVLLASHDGDFHPQISSLVNAGQRRVGLLGFREFVNSQFTELTASGLEIFDLEDRVQCFTIPLPRVRVIPIDEFDPVRFL